MKLRRDLSTNPETVWVYVIAKPHAGLKQRWSAVKDVWVKAC